MTTKEGITMNSYLIERNLGRVTPDQIAAAGSMSKRVANDQFRGSIVWKHSYAAESDAGLRTYCVFESADEATVRAHSEAAGLPCDSVTQVNVIGPDDFS